MKQQLAIVTLYIAAISTHYYFRFLNKVVLEKVVNF